MLMKNNLGKKEKDEPWSNQKIDENVKAIVERLSESDIKNINEVLSNKEKYYLEGTLKEPKSLVEGKLTKRERKKLKETIFEDVLNFYDSINPLMGKKMREIYGDGSGIFMDDKYDVEKFGEGYTIPKKEVLPNGKKGRCIINFQNNYLTYYTTAHEFMHLLQFELQKEKSEKGERGNLEIDTRFIEHLMGEYLVEKKSMPEEDRENHVRANNAVYEEAETLNYLVEFKKLMDSNGGNVDEKVWSEFAKKYCKGNIEEARRRAEQELKATGCNSLENRLLFVNAMVDVNKLVEEYEKDKEKFKSTYAEIILRDGPVGAKDFSAFLEKVKEEKENEVEDEKNIGVEDEKNEKAEEKKDKESIFKKVAGWLKNKFNKKQKRLPEGNVEATSKKEEEEDREKPRKEEQQLENQYKNIENELIELSRKMAEGYKSHDYKGEEENRAEYEKILSKLCDLKMKNSGKELSKAQIMLEKRQIDFICTNLVFDMRDIIFNNIDDEKLKNEKLEQSLKEIRKYCQEDREPLSDREKFLKSLKVMKIDTSSLNKSAKDEKFPANKYSGERDDR